MIGWFQSTPSKGRLPLASVVALALMSAPAAAVDFGFTPELKKAGWRIHTPRGKDAAEFDVQSDGSLSVRADGAVAFLYCFVPDEAAAGQVLSWQWRVDRDFPATDLSLPGKDDRPLAVHVYFSDKNSGLLKRLGRGMANMFGVPVSGRAITYVWGGQSPAGTMILNPFMDDGEGVLIVRRSAGSGPLTQWLSEEIDLAADYRMAFGGSPPPVSVVAISADTDDTGSESLARIKDLKLTLPPTGRH